MAMLDHIHIKTKTTMTKGLRDEHYVNDEEVKTPMMKWLKERSTEFYKVGIHTLI